jgi:hypothetical protein
MSVEVRRFLEDDLDAVCVGLALRPASTHRRRLERQRRDGYVQLIAWIDGAPVGAVGLGGGPGGRESRTYASTEGSRSSTTFTWRTPSDGEAPAAR